MAEATFYKGGLDLVPGMNCWRSLTKALFTVFLITLLVLSSLGTQSAMALGKARPAKPEKSKLAAQLSTTLAEAPLPLAIQELRKSLEKYQPQVTILYPKPNEILIDNRVSVRFQVKDLPIFKDEKLGLGPHLHVLLDNSTYQAVYDLNKPLVLENLEPGTHTIRAFASRPWHESFKNEGAYTQVSFHVFTKTQENSPNPSLPLLTYSRPQSTYGAEPIMLDFYLTNAPLHLVAQENPEDDIADWRIRCTVNGKSFLLDRWQPVYLKGFKPGKNWVQLEFLDEQGNPINNVFNNTARVITYEPNGKDTLSRLTRGELAAAEAQAIVDPNYAPQEPIPTPTPSPEGKAQPAPKPKTSPVPLEAPKAVKPSPVPVSPSPQPSAPLKREVPERKESPEPIELPARIEVPAKIEAPGKIEAPKLVEPQIPPETSPAKPETSKPQISKPEIPKPVQPEKPPGESSGLPGFLNRFRQAPKAVTPTPKPVPLPSPIAPAPSQPPTESHPPIPPSPTVTPSPAQRSLEPKPTANPTTVPTKPALESPKPQPSPEPKPTVSPTAVPAKPTVEPDAKAAKPRALPSFLNRLRPSPSPVAPGEPGKPVQSPPSNTKSSQPQPLGTPDPVASPPNLPVQPSIAPSPVAPSAKVPAQPAPSSPPPALNRSRPSPSPTTPSSPTPAKAIAPVAPVRPIPASPAPSPSVAPSGTIGKPSSPEPSAVKPPETMKPQETIKPQEKLPENKAATSASPKPAKKPTASDFYERLRQAKEKTNPTPTSSPAPVPSAVEILP